MFCHKKDWVAFFILHFNETGLTELLSTNEQEFQKHRARFSGRMPLAQTARGGGDLLRWFLCNLASLLGVPYSNVQSL